MQETWDDPIGAFPDWLDSERDRVSQEMTTALGSGDGDRLDDAISLLDYIEEVFVLLRRASA